MTVSKRVTGPATGLWAMAWVLALAGCSQTAAPPAGPAADGAGAATAAASAAGFPAALQALGNEPFWSVQVDGSRLHWSSPDKPDGLSAEVQRREQDGVLTLTGSLEGKPVTLEVRAGQCSDGMSDTVYPWQASWRQGDTTLGGCARPPLAP